MWCWRILPKCHTKLFPLEFSLCKYLPWNLYEWCCHHSRWTYKDSSSGSLETKIQTSFSTCLMSMWHFQYYAAAAAKSLQSCPTLCSPIDGSPPHSSVPGILQARTLEWVAISFSNARKWKLKWSRSVVSNSSRPHGLQPTSLLCPWDFSGKSTGVGCHRRERT